MQRENGVPVALLICALLICALLVLLMMGIGWIWRKSAEMSLAEAAHL